MVRPINYSSSKKAPSYLIITRFKLVDSGRTAFSLQSWNPAKTLKFLKNFEHERNSLKVIRGQCLGLEVPEIFLKEFRQEMSETKCGKCGQDGNFHCW